MGRNGQRGQARDEAKNKLVDSVERLAAAMREAEFSGSTRVLVIAYEVVNGEGLMSSVTRNTTACRDHATTQALAAIAGLQMLFAGDEHAALYGVLGDAGRALGALMDEIVIAQHQN